MSYPISDEESTDSDSGIRFKTASTRNKFSNESQSNKKSATKERERNSYTSQSSSRYGSHRSSRRDRSRDRSDSRHRRDKSGSREHQDQSRKRSHRRRTPEPSYSSAEVRKSEEYRRREKSSTSHRKKEKRRSRSRESRLEKCEERQRTNHRLDADAKSKSPDTQDSSDDEDIQMRRRESSNSDTEKYRKSKKPTKESESDDCGPQQQQENSESESEIDHFGPALPPHLKKNSSPLTQSSNDSYGPALPPSAKINLDSKPQSQNTKVVAESMDCDGGGLFGSALPPPVKPVPKSEEDRLQDETDIGPALPPHMLKQPKQNDNGKEESVTKTIGPYLPPHLRTELLKESENNTTPIQSEINKIESEDEDDVIGPLPAGQVGSNPSYVQLEERALQMKLDGLKQAEKEENVREEWMLELPEVRAAGLGLGPRQFRAKGVPDMSDRSSWTDTPKDKANKQAGKQPAKVDLKKEAELRQIQERDLEQQQIVEKHKKKKKRDKSLLDIHQDELNKKKKKDEDSNKNERRPFSRDIDLKVNRFDEAQKKAIMKKAQLLDTRFSSGESKFL